MASFYCSSNNCQKKKKKKKVLKFQKTFVSMKLAELTPIPCQYHRDKCFFFFFFFLIFYLFLKFMSFRHVILFYSFVSNYLM